MTSLVSNQVNCMLEITAMIKDIMNNPMKSPVGNLVQETAMNNLLILLMMTILQSIVIRHVRDQVNQKANHKVTVTRLFTMVNMTC